MTRHKTTTDRSFIEARFWAHVNKADNCWLWMGCCDRDGYGKFTVIGRSLYAHRFSWEMRHGHIADPNIVICHHCDNPKCVNPDHLFPGSHADNVHDMISKKRNMHGDKHWTRLHPERMVERSGERSPMSKLTRVQVNDIRAEYAGGGTSFTKLSKKYPVSRSALHLIVTGARWASTMDSSVLIEDGEVRAAQEQNT